MGTKTKKVKYKELDTTIHVDEYCAQDEALSESFKIKSLARYIVLSDECHEFDIDIEEVANGKLYTLSHSNSDIWKNHSKGEKQLEMLDTGDDVIFTPPLHILNYADICNLRLLINLDHILDENPKNLEKYRLVEVSNTIEI